MKILLFGATGSVGNAALEVCETACIVDEVRAVTRRPLISLSPKLRAYLHKDFLNYATIEEAFRNVDACLFCLGISSMQVSQENYRTITYSYTLAAANMLKRHSPAADFHYISGQGTSLTSRMFWSRVKAQTEHDLIELIDANCFRPAFIDAKPQSSSPRIYAALAPLGRLFKPFPNLYIHGHDLARAMLQATHEKLRRRIFENAEIRQLASHATF